MPFNYDQDVGFCIPETNIGLQSIFSSKVTVNSLGQLTSDDSIDEELK